MSDFYALTVKDLSGADHPLETYRGKVSLVVNVASQCGYTRQYAGLQALSQRMKDRPFALLAFPSNDFGAQEPGSAEEIRSFCSTRYGVTFPIMAKIAVKGSAAAAPYALLSEAAGAPAWNFHKYLVGKDGTVLQAFPSRVEPDSPELLAAIEKALA